MRPLILGIAGAILFAWGLAAGEFHVFPYEALRQAKNLIDGQDGARDPAQYAGSPHTREIGLGDAVWNTKADVVMLGDSITANGRWQEMFPGVDIVNRGIGGDTVLGVRERLPSVIAAEPDQVFILIGTNDTLFRNPEPDFLAYYDDVVEALVRSGARVYVQSIPKCSDSSSCDAELRATIDRLNLRLRTLAARRGATFVDLGAALSDADGWIPDLTWDGLHPNARGYLAWREVLRPYIDSELSELSDRSARTAPPGG